MLMGDFPLAVDLAEANGRAHPDIGFFSVRSGASEVIEAAGEPCRADSVTPKNSPTPPFVAMASCCSQPAMRASRVKPSAGSSVS